MNPDLVGAFQSEVARASAWLAGPGSRFPIDAVHGDASGNVSALDGQMVRPEKVRLRT